MEGKLDMLKPHLVAAALVLAVAGSSASAYAHQHQDSGSMRQGSDMMKGQQRGGNSGPMMNRDMMGQNMMGPNMMVMMMAMMDTNGDSALSLDEIQAVHARMFKYADTDGDGKLTLDEMKAFMHGGMMKNR